MLKINVLVVCALHVCTHVYVYFIYIIYWILDCANVCRFSCPYTYPPPRLRDWRGKGGGVPLVYLFLFRFFCASVRLTVCRLSVCPAASSVLLTVLFYCSRICLAPFSFSLAGRGLLANPSPLSPPTKKHDWKIIKTKRKHYVIPKA